ncbi:hypothetical protein [Paenibacillus agricola]|uniref:Uncharacterized protein n=1 Tax=Paenibacillus agricola TaxID=2716264 RepID=A0ABX0JHM7_9BACL|nr:hypothetical protein [Paenibacillus agricola]NHN34771.1 hypothetical protein [Paenibacillus agricola]
MKKSTTILLPEEVISVVQIADYEDKARKFTVYHLLQYWCMAAFEEWGSYRYGVDHAASIGFFQVKLRTFYFRYFKALFHLLVSKCNRKTSRKLAFPKE